MHSVLVPLVLEIKRHPQHADEPPYVRLSVQNISKCAMATCFSSLPIHIDGQLLVAVPSDCRKAAVDSRQESQASHLNGNELQHERFKVHTKREHEDKK